MVPGVQGGLRGSVVPPLSFRRGAPVGVVPLPPPRPHLTPVALSRRSRVGLLQRGPVRCSVWMVVVVVVVAGDPVFSRFRLPGVAVPAFDTFRLMLLLLLLLGPVHCRFWRVRVVWAVVVLSPECRSSLLKLLAGFIRRPLRPLLSCFRLLWLLVGREQGGIAFLPPVPPLAVGVRPVGVRRS